MGILGIFRKKPATAIDPAVQAPAGGRAGGASGPRR